LIRVICFINAGNQPDVSGSPSAAMSRIYNTTVTSGDTVIPRGRERMPLGECFADSASRAGADPRNNDLRTAHGRADPRPHVLENSSVVSERPAAAPVAIDRRCRRRVSPDPDEVRLRRLTLGWLARIGGTRLTSYVDEARFQASDPSRISRPGLKVLR
jgi:hypothetical protein